MSINNFILTTSILCLLAQNIKSEGVIHVNILCLELNKDYKMENHSKVNGHHFISSSLSIESPKTVIEHASFLNGTIVDNSDVTWLTIETANTSVNMVKFIPFGIKKHFPKLEQLEIMNTGLCHLERYDMKQFGEDLIYVNLQMNALTALEEDVFQFNTNVKRICLDSNPLTYISPQLFVNLNNDLVMKNLSIVQFKNSTCIDQEQISYFHRVDMTRWNSTTCNDEISRSESLKIMCEREEFFISSQQRSSG